MAQLGTYVLTVGATEYDFETAPVHIQHKVRKLIELVGSDLDAVGTPGSRVTPFDKHNALLLARKWGRAHP